MPRSVPFTGLQLKKEIQLKSNPIYLVLGWPLLEGQAGSRCCTQTWWVGAGLTCQRVCTFCWSGPSSAIALWSPLQRPGFACQMYFMTLINIHTYPEHLDRKWSLKAPCSNVLPLLQARGILSETHTLRKQAASLLDLMHTHSDQSIFIWSTYIAWNQA